MKDKIQAAFKEIRADDALKRDTLAYVIRESESENYSRKDKGFAVTKWTGALAAVAAVVMIAGIFSYNLHFAPYSHVSIDVNPSVELTLNRLDRVIATHAFNEDGERILRETDLRGERYDKAAGLIMSRIENDGSFADDVLVSVTVQTSSGSREQILCAALRETLTAHDLPESAGVEVFPVSAKIRSHAHSCNLSPAKYLAIQELLEVDDEATVTQYGDSTITRIRQRTQECRSHMADGADASAQGHMHGHMHGNGH